MIFSKKYFVFTYINWAVVVFAIAQSPIPAFPEIELVEQIFSQSSAQFHLKQTKGRNELLKYDKGINEWIVNLKEVDIRNIHFSVRTTKLKLLYEGKIKYRGKGKWQLQIGHAMPGQSVALLFIAEQMACDKKERHTFPCQALPNFNFPFPLPPYFFFSFNPNFHLRRPNDKSIFSKINLFGLNNNPFIPFLLITKSFLPFFFFN